MARGNRDLMTEALQMQRGVSANQARAADDENFHDVFLFLFCISKSIRHSSRVFRETKRIEGKPARLHDTPSHSARRPGRTDFEDSSLEGRRVRKAGASRCRTRWLTLH